MPTSTAVRGHREKDLKPIFFPPHVLYSPFVAVDGTDMRLEEKNKKKNRTKKKGRVIQKKKKKRVYFRDGFRDW
jgi:hypothetical protein